MAEQTNQELIEQFKLIIGFEANDDSGENDIDSKITRLLTIHDYNLNNSISTYFDSQFETIESINSINNESETGISTSIEAREIEELIGSDDQENGGEIGELIHRSTSSNTRGEFVNLQSQMFMNSMMPRLPKAPTIPMRWQLDVGLYSSILHDKEQKEKEKEQERSEISSIADSEKSNETYEYKDKTIRSKCKNSSNGSILNTLWFILLIIPKNFLSIILTSIKYLFGVGSWGDNINGNNFSLNKSFNFDENFNPNYSCIKALSEETDNQNIKKFNNLKDSDFNEIHQHCQKEYDWLLVILTNDSQENQNFIQGLFNNKNFQKNFNTENGIYNNLKIYLGNIDNQPESFEIAKTYKIKKLPYVMLIANVSSSPDIMASMSIVYKSNISSNFIESEKEIKTTISKIIKNLIKNIEKFNPQLISAKYDKQEMEFSRLIRQQQDDAYTESLVRDQIKKQEKQDKILKESKIRNLKNLKIWYINKLLNDNFIESITGKEDSTETSPSTSSSSSASLSTSTTASPTKLRVSIKLPNGKRIIENLNSKITILEFYIFIELKIYLTNETKLEEEDLKSLEIEEEYKTRYKNHLEFFKELGFKFNIIQPYPKKIIQCNSSNFIGDLPEFKGANFLIEFNDENEDESEIEEENEELVS
ncbi:uncharacterized protein KGF55_001224 [Candida pseudojiufengensis]|uniref:uncharacterized protein n=1 Tax=Candida pseudojiufengensis TaxID=497109 RepID=UPI002224C395|nr:uncharacterized protein KGF55_001224 [Candida pseudojiufengensis]KAI5965861.1 hypothetical protein KGF55_001224 [Candida pseudojiufengensis]